MWAHLEQAGCGRVRQFRFFIAACCKRVERWFTNSRQCAALAVLERYAEGFANRNELAVCRAALDITDPTDAELPRVLFRPESDEGELVFLAAEVVREALTTSRAVAGLLRGIVETVGCAAIVADQAASSLDAQLAEHRHLANVLRDVFGNPFRPVAFDPVWRTDTAVTIARQMYNSREFGAMPILADALQDAGCEDEQVLTHCRDANQVHVRGCWVCDLVLGKD